jgi:hypothetical protein
MAQFSWAAGMDVASGIAGAFASWANASSQRILSKAAAQAQAVVRDGQNKQRAANLSLAATMRSIADDAVLNNAGDSYNSMSELIARTQEAAIRGNVEQGLRNAEQIGAFAARSAAAGVGGASVHMVSYSMRLQQARLAERMQERNEETTYELLKQRSGIMPAAVSRMDVTPLNANFDYSFNGGQAGNGPSLAASLVEGLLSKRASLQVALDSISQDRDTGSGLTTGDFSRMDRLTGPITID